MCTTDAIADEDVEEEEDVAVATAAKCIEATFDRSFLLLRRGVGWVIALGFKLKMSIVKELNFI